DAWLSAPPTKTRFVSLIKKVQINNLAVEPKAARAPFCLRDFIIGNVDHEIGVNVPSFIRAEDFIRPAPHDVKIVRWFCQDRSALPANMEFQEDRWSPTVIPEPNRPDGGMRRKGLLVYSAPAEGTGKLGLVYDDQVWLKRPHYWQLNSNGRP